MNPLVSIIVPVYNTETFVLRTLKSVSTQDYNNLEVIIIDDKSTDHSIQVIDNFIKQNSDTKKTFILLKNEENSFTKCRFEYRFLLRSGEEGRKFD